MAIDFSALAFPKSRVRALDKADKAAALAKQDKAENAKARKRAKGRCEVWEIEKVVCKVQMGPIGSNCVCPEPKPVQYRCGRKDTETHHLIGGIGRRNKGKSILADYKLRVCKDCHAAITANILRPTTAEHDASTVRYWRSR
jgi:hypothetical protein